MSLLLGSAGMFAAPVTYATGNLPTSIAAGDLTGDGLPDLAITQASGCIVLHNTSR